MSRLRVLPLAGIALLLAACEPSETDMRGAAEAAAKSQNQGLSSMVGRITGGPAPDLSSSVTAFKKIACKEASPNPGYVCDYQVTAKGPLGEMTSTETSRFVKGENGWTIVR